MADWYGGDAAFDKAVRDLAGDWYMALRSQPGDVFLTDPDTACAAIILFDQVPRNIFRGSADAFATDTLALAIAREMVARGWDQSISKDQRQFVYMPYEHSEDMEDQRESLRLFAALGDANSLEYARQHFDIIKRFGRFAHRNAVLGRKSRAAESAAIEEGKNW